jgi:putative polyketide hydroxylase
MSVLVVGAGPAGLVAAITLARYGVRTHVVERRSSLSAFPRATGISLRSMEIIRSFGLECAVRAGEMDVGTTGWVSSSLASPSGTPASLGFPSLSLSRDISPTTPVAAPQDHLEPVLLAYLSTLPSASVSFGTELVSLDQSSSGVVATLQGPTGLSTVHCDYVIGADGAHSAVRTSTGIEMIGPSDLGSYVAVLFRAPLASVVGDRRHALYMISRPGPPWVFLPTDNRDRWVFSFPSSSIPSSDELVALMRSASGVPSLSPEILRVGSFSFTAQVATQYRSGRAFLIGDAAHRMTPRGGTGMNTAIHDAFDLGWKLAWVLRGYASDSLLDTYETERRPIGVRNTSRSASPQADRDVSQDYLDDLDGRLPHVWLPDGRSTLDLLGPGLTLLLAPSSAVAAPTSLVPTAVHRVPSSAASALGIPERGSLLVRPDGKPYPAMVPA